MVLVSIKKQEEITNQGHFQSMEEAQAWIAKHEAIKSFGQPKQVLQHEVEVEPAVLNEDGSVLKEAVKEMQEEVIESDYEILIEDISAKLEQEKINQEAQAFLDATDYKVVRAMERGEELSPEFKAERQAARDRIVK
jgi:hypothetical protein